MRVNRNSLRRRVGIELRKARNTLGYTQRDVGEAVGLRQNSISYIEHGKQPIWLDDLYDICLFLDLEPVKVLPTIEELTKPAKHTIAIGGKIVEITIEEALSSVRKLNEILGGKKKE